VQRLFACCCLASKLRKNWNEYDEWYNKATQRIKGFGDGMMG